MSLLALQLGDSAISCLHRGAILLVEPGYAAIELGRLVFGSSARHQRHRGPRSFLDTYWRDLSQEPLGRPEFQALSGITSTADVVHAHVEDLWRRCPADIDAVICVVPHYWSKGQLALISGIFAEVGVPVKALVDNAVASVRREYVGSTVSVIDASLHDVSVSIIQQSGGASIEQRLTIEDIGIQRLERFCVDYISAQFIEQCRFDPMSTSESEQIIFDRLHTWLGRIERATEARLDMEFGGNRFQATLTAEGLSKAVFGFCEPLALRLRELLGPRDRQAVLLDFGLAGFPGVVRCLESVAGSTVEILKPAAGALGVLGRKNSLLTDGDEIRYLTRLPWDQLAVAAAEIGTTAASQSPTHVLFSNAAYRLGDRPFEIGSEVDDQQHGVRLDGPAVSRSHCSIRLDGSQAIVSDHSRFGTRVNGHHIDGNAVLQVGDTVGVGDPAQEFLLIREEQASGPTQI